MNDLTTPEIHNWYNNLVKRFGWIALSADDAKKKKNYKDEINDLMNSIERKTDDTIDLDRRKDLETMSDKLKGLSMVLDEIKGGNKKTRKARKTLK